MRTGPSSDEKAHAPVNAICDARDVVKNANGPARVAEARAIIQNATLELRALLDNEIAAAFPPERKMRSSSQPSDLTTQAEALLRGLKT